MSNGNDFLAIKAKLEGKQVADTWGNSWNGFDGGTEEEIEQECRNKSNPSQCVADRKIYNAWMTAKEKGYTGDLDKFKKQNNLLGIGAGLWGNLQSYLENKNGVSSSTYNSYTPNQPTKSNTWIWVTVGIIGVAGIVGLIWYSNKNKGK